MIALVLAIMSQEPPEKALRRVTEAHATAVRLGKTMGDSIWPGFRPDTIPILYVLPDTGTLLLGWRGDLPAGFVAVKGVDGGGWRPQAERGAASTGTVLAGRPTAQVVAAGLQGTELVGLTAHEAFHAFQSAVRVTGRRFGTGENSFLVSSYPEFDAANEAGMVLEVIILGSALSTQDSLHRREMARQFVAVRERRHRSLGDEYATFERLAELNEGLADYARLRMKRSGLIEISDAPSQSIRLRFYRLGAWQASLLDRLEGPGWKARLMRDDLTLQEALATASGWRDVETATAQQAEQRFRGAALRAAADSDVAELRALRRAQVDSAMSAPGVQLVVALDSIPGRTGLCFIDPQNLLQVDKGVLLHSRMVRACAGAAFDAMFTTPTVDERSRGSIRAVIGPLDSLRVTAGGKTMALTEATQTVADLKIESSRITLTTRRADVTLRGSLLTVRPRP